MGSSRLEKLLPMAAFLIYLAMFYSSIRSVPFHPDEATQIYMSRDVRLMFTNPTSLLFKSEPAIAAEQRYRLIDAPLPRTIIGITYVITDSNPIPNDWNWSLSWDKNITNGAFPSEIALLVARISLGMFVPLGLIIFYIILKNLTTWRISLGVATVLGLNALFLLHTRRAMAEGISFSLFMAALFLLIKRPQNAILLGIFIGLAIQAKQTSLPLLPVPLVFWSIDAIKEEKYLGLFRKTAVFIGSILVIYYLLNPIIWNDPIRLTILQIQTRVDFSQSQAVEYLALSSPLAVTGISSRMTAWLANTYIASPAYFDVGNYSNELLPAITTYKSIVFHRLFTGWIFGAIILITSLAGMLLSLFKKSFVNLFNSRSIQIMWVVSCFQTVFSILAFPITFQRYYLLNLTLVFIWTGIGMFNFLNSATISKPK